MYMNQHIMHNYNMSVHSMNNLIIYVHKTLFYVHKLLSLYIIHCAVNKLFDYDKD